MFSSLVTVPFNQLKYTELLIDRFLKDYHKEYGDRIENAKGLDRLVYMELSQLKGSITQAYNSEVDGKCQITEESRKRIQSALGIKLRNHDTIKHIFYLQPNPNKFSLEFEK